MLLTVEIISVIALSALFIYLKREQARTFIKKAASYKLFPKIFWGFILGLGISYFEWPGNEFFGGFFKIFINIKILDTTAYIRGLHFVGPLFGIFVGITIGVSSRLFSVKKLLICILAGFLGGLAYSTQIFLSAKPNFIQSIDMFTLAIFVLTPMPFAIGIADKSLLKVIIGLIGEGIGIVFFFLLFVLGIYLTRGELIGLGKVWGVYSRWEGLIVSVIIIMSAILILLGIEMSELGSNRNVSRGGPVA